MHSLLCTNFTPTIVLKCQYFSFSSTSGMSFFLAKKKLHYDFLSPLEPPGKVIDLKVTGSTYNTLSLSWTKPKEEKGEQDEAKGYFVEIRPAESTEWNRCNSHAVIMSSYTVKGLKSMAMYWVRVIAVNEGGEGEPQELNKYILAMPPPGMSLNGNHLFYRPKHCCSDFEWNISFL